MIRMLVVVEDLQTRTEIKKMLLDARIEMVELIENGEQAMRHLADVVFDLVVLDFDLPDRFGLRLMETLKSRGAPTEIIVLVRGVTLEEIIRAVNLGAIDILQKPLSRKEFVESVLRTLERRTRSPHYLANRLNLYLIEHSQEHSLQLSDLCRKFRISRGYATRLFQQHLGTTFRERLAQYRVENAKKLLTTTDDPIYSIAKRCGFKNSKRLAESFRRVLGTSPVKFRQFGYGRL